MSLNTPKFLRQPSGTSALSNNWNDQLKTYFGGHKEAIDPIVTGYHYFFITLPSSVKLNNVDNTFFTMLNRRINIPDLNVNDIEFEGLNNLTWGVPGTVEWSTKRFTAAFLVTSGMPITRALLNWVFSIRNMFFGVSSLKGYSQTQYKGHAAYGLVRPDGQTLEFACIFSGVYPGNVPLSVFNSEKFTMDKIEMEVEFHFDEMFIGDEVSEAVASKINNAYNASVSAISNRIKSNMRE